MFKQLIKQRMLDAYTEFFFMTEDCSIPTLVFASAAEWRMRNDVAIHKLRPTENEFYDAIETAYKDNFPTIVIYL